MNTPATTVYGQQPVKAGWGFAHPAGAHELVMQQTPLRQALRQPQAATEATASSLYASVQPPPGGLVGSYAAQGKGQSVKEVEGRQLSGLNSVLLMGNKPTEHADRPQAAQAAPSPPVAGVFIKGCVQLTLY